MKDSIRKKGSRQEKLCLPDYAMEVVGWLQIVASPLIGGIFLGGMAYHFIGDTSGVVVGIVIPAAALVLGILYANRVRDKKGAANFMAKVNASPELDDLQEDERHKTEVSKNAS